MHTLLCHNNCIWPLMVITLLKKKKGKKQVARVCIKSINSINWLNPMSWIGLGWDEILFWTLGWIRMTFFFKHIWPNSIYHVYKLILLPFILIWLILIIYLLIWKFGIWFKEIIWIVVIILLEKCLNNWWNFKF